MAELVWEEQHIAILTVDQSEYEQPLLQADWSAYIVNDDNWNTGNTGDNSSGFTGLGAGRRLDDGTFSSILFNTNFASSSLSGSNQYRLALFYNQDLGQIAATTNKKYGYSIRLIKI
jgi:uncharacterized protein (TIGR02145 family)